MKQNILYIQVFPPLRSLHKEDVVISTIKLH